MNVLNKKYFSYMAMAMGLAVSAYDGPQEQIETLHRENPQGRRCGECALFGQPACKCRLAKQTSPACSQFSRRY